MKTFATACLILSCAASLRAEPLEAITVSEDGKSFVHKDSKTPFKAWGVNYDHDAEGRLLEDYWVEEWDAVVEDFEEIKALGCNVVRIHLQTGKFMKSADEANGEALGRLRKLVELAEEKGIYLDVTGLGCYHKKDVPEWFDALDEAGRWEAQAKFWEAVAGTCANSPAIFCYDLMNEPVLPGAEPVTDWLAGELGGKFFVQRLGLELKGRTREEMAKAWVDKMAAAIRRHDKEHMITVGVIPWALAFHPNVKKPLFYGPETAEALDFVSVHFYPESGAVDKALEALEVYEIGKPLVIEEMFALKCGIEEMDEFIDKSKGYVDGYISFYWGKSAKEYAEMESPELKDAIMKRWLEYIERKRPWAEAPRD